MQETAKLDLLSLFGQDQINDIQQRLSKIIRLGFVTVNYRGEPVSEYTDFCAFCSHFRQHEELSKNCIASDAMSSIQAAISQKPLIYQCPCGLMEIAIPIIVNGAYLGGFLCGQARCTDAPKDIMRMRPAVSGDLFEKTISDAESDLSQLPAFDYQHFEDIAALVNLVVTLLCESKIHEMECEQTLINQINSAAFLEKHLQRLTAALHGNDYAALMEEVSIFTAKLHEEIPQADARLQLLQNFVSSMDRIIGGESALDSLRLFPLHQHITEKDALTDCWLSQLTDYYFRHQKEKQYPLLESVFAFINQHLTEDLSLSRIVEECAVSQSYLSRLFRNLFDLSVTDYIHLRKMQVAKIMILEKNKSAAEIAFELGYTETTYFSKVFKKVIGCTIQEYKKR